MNDSEVKLTLNQVQRYEIGKALLEGRLTIAEAARALDLSHRQVQRLKRRLQAAGPQGLIHGNTARPPANKTPDRLRQRVLDLAATTYAQFNFSHLADILAEEHRIYLSDETLRRWLRPLGHGRAPRRGKHRRRRTRRSREGELLFLDGSPHPWFGPAHPCCCLLLASDDASGKPLWGKFQPEEDRDGCFEVCYHVFVRFGLPAAFYLDRASQFVTTRHGGLRALHDPDREPTHCKASSNPLFQPTGAPPLLA
jgi:transposase